MGIVRLTDSTRAAGAIASVLTTELNSLADGAGALSGALSNDAADERDLYADLALVASFASAPSSGAVVDVYLVAQFDASYEDAAGGSTPVLPADGFVGSVPVLAQTASQRRVLRRVPLPPYDFKVLLVNNAGVAMAGSGSALRARFYTEQTA